MTSRQRTPAASRPGRAGPPGPPRSRWPGWLLASLLAAVVGTPPAARAGEPVRAHEYELKAVFLHKVTRFVDWGLEGVSSTDRLFVVGVLGEDPFGDTLDELFREGLVHGRKAVVRRFAGVRDLEGCHLLFVARSEAGDVCRILRELDGRPTLTVSDIPDFSALGGIMTLTMEDARVRLQINPAAPERAGLRINSNLLRLAKTVDERECE